jgi:Probable cobalt transporter subunit (CbtB)
MADVAVERGSGALPKPVASPGELIPYAIFAGVIMLLLIYFVGGEQGATSMFSGNYVHEFMHDGRHLLAFPCH